MSERKLVDHVLAWTVAAFLGAMSTTMIVGPLLPPPEGVASDGLGGFALFGGIAFGYAAAAVLQSEYGTFRGWRPTWGQGLGLTWFGGWVLLTAIALMREFLFAGLPRVRELYGAAMLVLGLFVVAPLIGGWLIARSRRTDRGLGDV